MKKKFSLHILKKKQLPQVQAFLARLFGISVQEAEKYLVRSPDAIHEPTIMVARMNGKIVGMVMCQYHKDQVFHGVGLIVDPAYRQQGIGRALVQAAEEYVRALCPPGTEATILLQDGTKQKNGSSRFYEEMGFVHDAGTTPEGAPVLSKKVKSSAFNKVAAKKSPGKPRRPKPPAGQP